MNGGDERYTSTESEEKALLASLRPTLDDALARERGPMAWWRSRPTPARAAVVALMALGLPIGLTALAGSAFTPAQSVAERAVLIGLSGFAVLLAVVLAMRPLYRPPLSRAVAVATLAATLLSPIAVGILAYASHGAGPIGPAACLGMGLVLSLPGVALVSASARSPQLGATAFAAGAAAGFGGYLAIGLHCPHLEAQHVLVTHTPIVLALGLLSVVRGFSTRSNNAAGGGLPRRG